MEQQADLFTLKRFELMIEMATKKLQNEVNALKETVSSLNNEISSLKSQFTRFQFQVHQAQDARQTLMAQYHNVKSEEVTVDSRLESKGKEEMQNKPAGKPAQSSPRFGNYKPEDVSIYKFFYFGDKK